MPLTDEEDIFEDYEAVPMDLDIGEDDDDTDYEDVSHAAEGSSHEPDEEITAKPVPKPVKVRLLSSLLLCIIDH